jgi:CRISPR-associated protein Csm2
MSHPDVFSFRLNEIQNRREADNLRKKYEEWKIKADEPLVLSEHQLQAIIANTLDQAAAKQLVEWAEKIGYVIKAEGLSTAQIRRVFGAVREIQMKGFNKPEQRRALLLLKPKLAYTAGRERKTVRLTRVLAAAIDFVETEQQFNNFANFFEAIIAYHRAAGGSN